MPTRTTPKRRTRGTVEAGRFLEGIVGPLTFGRMLRSFRACEELSQAEMARRTGLPRQHLCDIERGRRAVSAERAAELATALGQSVPLFVTFALQDQLKSAGLKLRVKVEGG